MTTRERIKSFLAAHAGKRYTTPQLCEALGAAERTVRREATALCDEMQITCEELPNNRRQFFVEDATSGAPTATVASVIAEHKAPSVPVRIVQKGTRKHDKPAGGCLPPLPEPPKLGIPKGAPSGETLRRGFDRALAAGKIVPPTLSHGPGDGFDAGEPSFTNESMQQREHARLVLFRSRPRCACGQLPLVVRERAQNAASPTGSKPLGVVGFCGAHALVSLAALTGDVFTVAQLGDSGALVQSRGTPLLIAVRQVGRLRYGGTDAIVIAPPEELLDESLLRA